MTDTGTISMRVAEWVDLIYRPERLGAEPGRRDRIIRDRVRDLLKHGNACISRHDSVTGRGEWLSL